jgi:hypothetical protein
VVQIGPQDERPSPGSEASEAAGASTEPATDTVQLPKIPRDQATGPGGEAAKAESPSRSLSPSGSFPPEDTGDPDPPASSSSTPDPASRAGPSPSGAWPADARPISLKESVFTPWSERQHPPASGSRDAASAPSRPDRTDKDANAVAKPNLLADVDSPADVAAGAPVSRRLSSAHDPLSGPWPSFTKRTGEVASQTSPREVPDDVEEPYPADSRTAADTAAVASQDAADDVPASPATGQISTASPASPFGATERGAFASPPWRNTLSVATPSPDAQDTSADEVTGNSGPAGPAGKILLAGRRRIVQVVGVAAAVAGLVIAGGIYLYAQKASSAHAAGDKDAKPAHSPVAKNPEHVVSITPADGATAVNGAADIRVEFSAALSPTSPMPALKPAIAGTWQRDGNTAVFVPDRGFRQRTKVTVRVPAGSTGVTSTGGGLLAAPVTAQFRTGKYSSARLEQLLAQLGYLPLTWSPLSGSSPSLGDLHAQISAAYQPPAGSYTWQSGYPSELTSLWRPAKASLILRGAVIAFEADHQLALDGVIGPIVWRAMFRALAAGQMNNHGYTYALASQRLPETLTVWHNGHVIFHHLANTGIPAAPTAVGTDPVYLRYQHQIMRGRNPDGTKYADPVAWVAYFRSGEAVHYFPRYSYGSPQSLGCVELPYQPAKRIWPYLTFGTLVTVTAP